jgi:hypothetical protein
VAGITCAGNIGGGGGYGAPSISGGGGDSSSYGAPAPYQSQTFRHVSNAISGLYLRSYAN